MQGSNPRTMRSWPEPKSDAQLTEPPRHPGVSRFLISVQDKQTFQNSELTDKLVSIQHPVLIPTSALLNAHHPLSPLPLPSTLSLFSVLKSVLLGCLGGSVSWASDFGSGHDLTVCEFKPHVGFCADSSEPGACFGFSVSLSLCPSPAHSLSLSVSKINKTLKKINKRVSYGLPPSLFVTFFPLPFSHSLLLSFSWSTYKWQHMVSVFLWLTYFT